MLSRGATTRREEPLTWVAKATPAWFPPSTKNTRRACQRCRFAKQASDISRLYIVASAYEANSEEFASLLRNEVLVESHRLMIPKLVPISSGAKSQAWYLFA
jgi:hypothetical protein